MTDRSHYFAAGEAWSEDMLVPWRFLIGPEPYSILRITAMGNLFLIHSAGSLHFLDTTDGLFQRVADSPHNFEALFDSSQNRRGWLWSHFVRELRSSGMMLGQGQCYGWKVPPCLGGSVDFKNIEPTDVAVHVSIQGQLHDQIRNLPPGTPIKNVRIIDTKEKR
jgi:hypothetical protein